MIFDDHDVRDDWNTSAVWRREMAEKPWWRERIRSALASYWVYQHLGNLPADELAADPDYQEVVAAEGDTWPLLAALADRADAETDGTKGVRFSFRWDLGATRFVMIDSRNGRILDDGAHLMLGESEFRWIEEQVRDRSTGDVEHLVLGTSLPWLLPHAIGDLQSINQLAAARPGWRGRLGESDPAGRGPGALAGVPVVVRPAHADGHGGRDRTRRAGEHQRALRRRPPQLRRPGRPAGPRRRPGDRAPPPSTSSPARRCTTSSTGSSGRGFRLGWSRRIARATPAVGRRRPGCRRSR